MRTSGSRPRSWNSGTDSPAGPYSSTAVSSALLTSSAARYSGSLSRSSSSHLSAFPHDDFHVMDLLAVEEDLIVRGSPRIGDDDPVFCVENDVPSSNLLHRISPSSSALRLSIQFRCSSFPIHDGMYCPSRTSFPSLSFFASSFLRFPFSSWMGKD